MNPGLLEVFPWSRDFNPNVQPHSSAQFWIKYFGLAQEHWHPKIMFAIRNRVGIPINVDQFTNQSKLENLETLSESLWTLI